MEDLTGQKEEVKEQFNQAEKLAKELSDDNERLLVELIQKRMAKSFNKNKWML